MARLPLALALALALSLLLVPPLVAERPPLPDDPSVLLGLSLAEVLADRGPPASVAALRGPEAWQDDVVFQYPEGLSLFWFGDRLWQLRFSAGYTGSVLGLFIGDGTEKVISLLGRAWYATGDTLVFRLPWRGFPVQLRAILREGRVSELFVFRSDY